jgi:hypothetical protein
MTDKLWAALVALFGVSAATTYAHLRGKGCTATHALAVTRAQVATFGSSYAGGFACVPFRKAYPVRASDPYKRKDETC